ncbi:MAG TPA: MFS transporter [Anaerolineales bacterium]|nr:MFS transporter [Anaerolineales bacterium]
MGERRLHHGWLVLAVSTLVVAGALGLARFGYSLVLPAMQSSLALDNTGAGALATANLIGYLTLSLIGGALASRYGPRLLATLGMTVVGVGMLLTGTAGGFVSALIYRALTGIGSGTANVPAMALVSAWFGVRRRGLAAGIAVAGSSLALISTGPTVPRLLAARPEDGWRLAWVIFGAVALAIALLAWIVLRNSPAELHLRPIGETQEPGAGHGARASSLDWGGVYRSGVVWHLGVVYLAFGFSYIIYMTFFVRYLVGEVGLTRQAAGNLYMLMGGFSLACGLIWGGLSDRIGRRWAIALVYLVQITAYLLFAMAPTSTGLTLSAMLFGLTAWSIPAIMAAACADVLGPRMAPAALGFTTLFFGIGQAIGPSVAGAMADASASFRGGFLVAAGVTAVGLLFATLLRAAPKPAFAALPLSPKANP